MPVIFISYARKNIDTARIIAQALEKNKIDILADWNLPKGEDWQQEIFHNIKTADIFLFLISIYSVASQHCNNEVKYALEKGKKIIPIVIGNETKEDSYKNPLRITKRFLFENVKYEINRKNFLFYSESSNNTAIEKLLEAINTDFEWVKFHNQLQNKALAWEQVQKDNSRLLRGTELQEAEQQLVNIENQKDPQPTVLQRIYLLESRRYADSIRRNITWSAVGVALIMILLSLFAWGQRNTAIANEKSRAIAQAKAEEQTSIAISRQLLLQAQVLSSNESSKHMEGVLLAIQSFRLLPTTDALGLLQRNFLATPISKIAHDNAINSAAFSFNGKYIVSGSDDKTVRIWEAATGVEVARMTHNDIVNVVEFSPDGKYVISGSNDKTVRIWDVATGEEFKRFNHYDSVIDVTFTTDGQKVISRSKDEIFRVWNMYTGKEISRIVNHNINTQSIMISPDGNLAIKISCNQSNTYYLCRETSISTWELSTDNEVSFVKYKAEVHSVAFSSNSIYIGFATDDEYIHVLDVIKGKEIIKIKNPNSQATSITFSLDGKIIASNSCTSRISANGCIQGAANIWEVATGNEIAHLTHDGSVNSISFSHDGKYVLTESDDKTARVWEITSGTEIAQITENSQEHKVALSPDGTYIASTNGSFLSLWSTNTGAEIARIIRDSPIRLIKPSPDGRFFVVATGSSVDIYNYSGKEISQATQYNTAAVAFSSDGNYLAIGGGLENKTTIVETNTGKEISQIKFGKYKYGEVLTVVFSPDGKYVASAGCKRYQSNICVQGFISMWDIASETEIASTFYDTAVYNIEFSSDGKYVVAYGKENIASLWDFKNNKKHSSTHNHDITPIAVSSDGKYVAGTVNNNSIQVLKTDTNEIIATQPLGDDLRVYHMIFDSESNYVIYGTNSLYDNSVRMWSFRNNKEIIIKQYGGTVDSIAVSLDGKFIVSGGCNTADSYPCIMGTVSVWDVVAGREISTVDYDGGVKSVTFSPDGKYIMLGTGNGLVTVLLYRPEDLVANTCKRITRNLTRQEWTEYTGDAIPYQPICTNLP